MLFAEDLKQVTWKCIHFISPGEEIKAQTELSKSDFLMLEVQGKNIATKENLFDALAKEMRIPDYFGMNWDALDECLRDMSWLPARGYILFFRDANSFWEKSPQVAGMFIESWLFAAEEWGRDNIPFHLIFIW